MSLNSSDPFATSQKKHSEDGEVRIKRVFREAESFRCKPIHEILSDEAVQ